MTTMTLIKLSILLVKIITFHANDSRKLWLNLEKSAFKNGEDKVKRTKNYDKAVVFRVNKRQKKIAWV